MKRSLPAFAFAALISGALPALAGTGTVDLPRLNFPDGTGAETSQGCTQPTTLSTDRCGEQNG